METEPFEVTDPFRDKVVVWCVGDLEGGRGRRQRSEDCEARFARADGDLLRAFGP